jgi:hypothetical protein
LDQLVTLKHFWPLLDDGGFYFIEDIAPGTLLFEKPSAVEAIIGGSNYFSVIDWAPIVGQAPPRRTLSNLIQRLFRRLREARPSRDEWKLLVIRKQRSSRG